MHPSPVQHSRLSSELQSVIDEIKINACRETESDVIFIGINFFEKKDSNFIWINYDISPPISPPPLPNEKDIKREVLFTDNYIGFYEYEENVYLLFYNRIADISIMENFINGITLVSSIESLRELYEKSSKHRHCDGEIYFYSIDNDKLIFLSEKYY